MPSQDDKKIKSLPWSYPVPDMTGAILQGHTIPASCHQLGLLIHIYLPYQAMARASVKEGQERQKRDADIKLFLNPKGTTQPQMVDKDKDKSRQRWLSEIASKISGALLPNGGDLRRLHEAWIGRWQALVEAWGATENGNHPTLFTAKSSGRVIVGLGGPSPLDTDMTLHHVYGLPYLPGSALKGLTHAYAEHTGQSEDDIKRIFGTTNGGGAVIFFDAIPGVGLTIDLDIMNPHYPDYYQDTGNQTPPSDDQSPIPIFFLTVKNSAFHFAVAPRPGAPEKAASAGQTGDREKSDAEIAACWLRDALEHEGIGGKTSSGYGRFEETKRT